MSEDKELKPDEQTAVVETNDAPQQGASAESETAQGDGLDELLREFDERKAESTPQETPQPKIEPKSESKVDIDALAVLERRLNDADAREQRRQLEGLCDRLVAGTQADAIDAEGFLIASAKRDPKLEQAYINRDKNPKAWERVEAVLKKQIADRFGKKVDKQVTESKNAVASAVRSASTAAPRGDLTDKDIATASKADFDEMQRKLGVTPV